MIAVQTTSLGFLGSVGDHVATSASRAHLMLEVAPSDTAAVEADLIAMSELTALHQITGAYDLVAVIEAAEPEALERVIERIRALAGVRRTEASVLARRTFDERNLRDAAEE